MAKRIKNLSIEKTPEYIEREWIAITAKRQQSLQSSDWTQLLDNDLTFEAQVRWNHWRTLVRSVTREKFPTIAEADAELDRLHASQPDKVYTHSTARQKKYQLDMTSLSLAKSDARKILREYLDDWLNSRLYEPATMTLLMVNELEIFLKSGREDFSSYPVLEAASLVNKWTVEQTIDGIYQSQHTLSSVMADMVKHRALYTEHINRALTIEEVIDVVKMMHGY